jgi:hypothetical protein
MRPAYRYGSSSEALSVARRTQLGRGLGLVLGVFLLYALASCFLPGLLPVPVYGGYHVGELAAATQVLVIALGVLCHDRHARRHVEPLAQRVATREAGVHADESRRLRTAGSAASRSFSSSPLSSSFPSPSSSSSEEPDADAAPFNAFDSSRAFGGRPVGGSRRAARATT